MTKAKRLIRRNCPLRIEHPRREVELPEQVQVVVVERLVGALLEQRQHHRVDDVDADDPVQQLRRPVDDGVDALLREGGERRIGDGGGEHDLALEVLLVVLLDLLARARHEVRPVERLLNGRSVPAVLWRPGLSHGRGLRPAPEGAPGARVGLEARERLQDLRDPVERDRVGEAQVLRELGEAGCHAVVRDAGQEQHARVREVPVVLTLDVPRGAFVEQVPQHRIQSSRAPARRRPRAVRSGDRCSGACRRRRGRAPC